MTDIDVPSSALASLREYVDRSMPAVQLPDPISSSDVRRFLNATSDRNPLWLDDEHARNAGYRERVVPPGYVPTLSWRLPQMGKNTDCIWADIPPPKPYGQVRNASTETEWLTPVYVGDRIAIQETLRDVTVRQGRTGTGIYVRYDVVYLNQLEHTVIVQQQTAVWLAGDGA